MKKRICFTAYPFKLFYFKKLIKTGFKRITPTRVIPIPQLIHLDRSWE